jgi:multidrug resistance efflux pump
MRTLRPRPVVTTVPLGSRTVWSWAISISVTGVVVSATLAQQQASAAPLTASDSPAVRRAGSARVQEPPSVDPPERASIAGFAGDVAGTSAEKAPRREVFPISAPTNGIVDVMFVRIGDRVEAGQPLLTFDDRQTASVASRLRVEIASARQHAVELEATLKALDAAIAAAGAQVPQRVEAETPPEAVAAVAHAQAIYNEAVARERRAAALQAHGIAITEELEAAQLEVRNAAEALTLAHREADAKQALASAQLLDARSQAESAVAAQRGERAQMAADLEATREKQRAAESALAEATADSAHLILRAPAPAIVTEMAVQPGDRAVNGTPLLKLERIP